MLRAEQFWDVRFPYIAFPLPFLGAGAVFAAFLNALHNYQAFDAAGKPALFPFLDGALGGALVFGILFAAAAILLARHDNEFLLRHNRKRVAYIISILCMLAGCTFLAISTLLPNAVPPLTFSIFGTVFGIGAMTAAFLWGAVFARLEPQSILFAAAVAFGFACLYNGAIELMSNAFLNYIGCGILIGISAWLLPAAAKDTTLRNDESNEQADASTSLSGSAKAKRAAKQLWMPLVGAIIATFIFGLTWDPTASSMPISNEPLTIVLRSFAGPLITIAIIMAAVIHKPDSSVIRIIQSALFPIAIAFLLALPTIQTDNLYLTAFTSLFDKASFSVIIVSIWTAITNASRTAQIPAHILLPLCLGILGGSSFLGLNLIHVIGTNGQTLCLVLFAIYLALIATSFAINTREEKASIVVEATSPNKSIQQRSDQIAAEYGLSPREIEVLYLLGRGYNHGYIATQLFISENTVRTHVRHIYTKLEISSREELIELIDKSKVKK